MRCEDDYEQRIAGGGVWEESVVPNFTPKLKRKPP